MIFTVLFELAIGFLFPSRMRHARGSLEEMTRRYPRSTVRRAELAGQESVAFVFANRNGLSFRDGYGGEEVLVRARDLGRLELLPTPDVGGQHLRVIDAAGHTILEFWSPADAGDVHADLGAALARR